MQRALTIKILSIGFLAVIMLIPLTMIQGKISERDIFRTQASNSVSQSWTGKQTVMTPVLVVPYTNIETAATSTNLGTKSTERRTTKYKFLQADFVNVSGSIATDTLMRGIYKIPVYETQLEVTGHFSNVSLSELLKEIASINQEQETSIPPFIAFYVSDPRGINNTPALVWQGQSIQFEPGTAIPTLSNGIHAKIPAINTPLESNLDFSLTLNLRGMKTLNFIPSGDLVDIGVESAWPHPEFVGAYLPKDREVTNEGFSANWRINQFASNIDDKLELCERGDCQPLTNTQLGVNLFDPVNVYLQSERSVKYGILFVGLSFISFFLFENIKRMRIHPIQYGLIGLSIATFYLLLISLSEHINFALSYLIATFACVTLIFSYLKFVLAGISNSLWFCGTLVALYTILYVIIQAEDFALLMGAVLVFGILSVVMIVTRRIDWYQVGEQMGKLR